MTIGAGGGSANSTRSSRKFSASKSRTSQHGSGAQGGESSLGSHPLKGAGTSKSDIKLRFEINKKLGSGTYGKVSLAYDHKTEREVAVKLIKKSAIENKQDLVRIRREIRIMSALKHPNIIQIFEVFENRDKIILVMEYASGGELYDYVGKYGSLPEAEARRIFRQITSAVLYCHKHQVVHRDLKLENILLDHSNNAKIADFGLSNYFSDKTLLTTFCGSPLYASPEIINGTPYRGPEVDCWSLGILLYTLVYGSMPFDGRDFNRMVRQIKRGAYFEPDTPSTASMLIRNMLRVNPERRADIYEIANHWWLNLEENMPVIQELPENQITDSTPLIDRAETILVQDLADETDVFMDFGHLSAATRLKIEEFRRRRKDAEDYIENSPVKPPKARKTDKIEEKQLTTAEKSLRGENLFEQQKPTSNVLNDIKDDFNEPLERLKQLETRLQSTANRDSRTKDKNLISNPSSAWQTMEVTKSALYAQKINPERPNDFEVPHFKASGYDSTHRYIPVETRRPSFVPLNSEVPSHRHEIRAINIQTWRMETDLLNMLMNQVLEQMENGPVSMNLIARIKAHPLYDSRPMVKELLESIIAAQPPSVQKQASKIIQQQSQELVRRQQMTIVKKSEKDLPDVVPLRDKNMQGSKSYFDSKISHPQSPNANRKKLFDDRPWHSVEVGFDPDEDADISEGKVMPTTNKELRTTNQEFETMSQRNEKKKSIDSSKVLLSSINTIEMPKTDEDEMSDEGTEGTDMDDEEYDTDIDELGNEVEQVEEDDDNVSFISAVSSQPNNNIHMMDDTLPQPECQYSTQKFLDTFDRGLAKRQSKGKYQHSKVELYGRGVSMECESPTISQRRIGGPQPTIEHSPFLFDKAKKYIMTYPRHIDDSEDDIPSKSDLKESEKQKNNWLKTTDPEAPESSIERQSHSSHSNSPISNTEKVISIRPLPTATKSEDEESYELDDEDEENENEQEEEEDDNEFEGKSEIMKSGILSATNQRTIFNQNQNLPIQSNDSSAMFETITESNQISTNKTMNGLQKGIESFKQENTIEEKRTEHLRTNRASTVPTNIGMRVLENATLYIRKKYLDKKRRNRVTGSLIEIKDSAISHKSPTEIYVKDYSEQITKAQPINYSQDDYNQTATTRFNADSNEGLHEQRKKSCSLHDFSPDKPEIKNLYTPLFTRNFYNTFSTNIDRFKTETPIVQSTMQSWANEPKKFYVYQTRAEREAERNTTINNFHLSSTFRIPGSSRYSTASERPLSPYSPGYYRSRFDDNFIYRRKINDADLPNATVSDVAASSLSPQLQQDYINSVAKRSRPVTKKMFSAATDSDRRDQLRSQSMDRKSYYGDDYHSNLRGRLMTPEFTNEKSDYSYVNYHDTSLARTSIPREPDHSRVPSKGILKNKQNTENEHRPIDFSLADILPSKEQSSEKPDDHQKNKKKSFLSLRRRRTTEMRLGPDGKIITAPFDDDYKRPASPIDRIKSFFRKSKEALTPPVTSQTTTGNHEYSQYNKASPLNVQSTRYGISDKTYSIHPSVNASPISARETSYLPQYRKYTGTNPSANYNRYSYISTASERPTRY